MSNKIYEARGPFQNLTIHFTDEGNVLTIGEDMTRHFSDEFLEQVQEDNRSDVFLQEAMSMADRVEDPHDYLSTIQSHSPEL